MLSKIQHRIKKEYVTEEPIPPKQKLAICLYRLGRGDYLYAIAEMVGLADSAVCQRSWIMKSHGDAVLTPEKSYCNYCLSRARMITKGAFGKSKGRFRVLFHKCESKKETVKVMGLACVVLHNLSIDKEDIIPRKFDLSYDHVTNKRKTGQT